MDTKYIEIYINGVKLPTPSTIEIEYSDLDADSLRPITTGKLKRNRVRSNMQKIKIGYLLNTISDIDEIMKMIEPKDFSVKVYDNATGNISTKTMYAGNKTFSYIRVKRGIKGQGFKFNLVEV